ncbi:MAG: DUF3859 domain-containing protein [Humidesulfovibrio sp.]|nr:DUF3859 domain-containing protein [Humidesulfovibrio sp.]
MRRVILCCAVAATLFVGGAEFVAARSQNRQGEAAQTVGGQGAQAVRVTGAKVLAVGLFSAAVARQDHSPDEADGLRGQTRDFRLLKRGNVLEAELGTGIGLRYQLIGAPKGAQVLVDVVVRHPQMVNPDTQLPMNMSSAEYERVIGKVEHSVWNFDTPGRLVPGEYVIEIVYRDQVLARQVFRVRVRK